MRNRVLAPLLFVTFIAPGVAGCGHAVSTGVVADPHFAELDTNHDGKLTLAESGLASAAFLARDTNQDGTLDILEWMGVGDTSGLTASVQNQHDTQRDESDQHRNGSTTRGAN